MGAFGIGAVDAGGQSSPILLAAGVLHDGSTGRVVLITLMACTAFLAVLTTVTSVTFAAAVSFAHDVFAQGRRRRTETGEVRALRAAAVTVCAVGLSLAAAIHRYSTDFLVAFSITVAASCIFPALLYSSFWRRLNQRGMLWSVYGGLLLCTVLTAFPPSFREPSSRCGRKRTSTGTRSRPRAWFPYLQRSFSGGSAALAHPKIPNSSFTTCKNPDRQGNRTPGRRSSTVGSGSLIASRADWQGTWCCRCQ
ncbi:hypothetical protein PV333_38805 [Streptomyces sp. NY05-11A]|nr:hypothetical protein [Streptomyces sp. NY05-11A]